MMELLQQLNDALVRWVAPLMSDTASPMGDLIELPIGYLGAFGIVMLLVAYYAAPPGSDIAGLLDKPDEEETL